MFRRACGCMYTLHIIVTITNTNTTTTTTVIVIVIAIVIVIIVIVKAIVTISIITIIITAILYSAPSRYSILSSAQSPTSVKQFGPLEVDQYQIGPFNCLYYIVPKDLIDC